MMRTFKQLRARYYIQLFQLITFSQPLVTKVRDFERVAIKTLILQIFYRSI